MGVDPEPWGPTEAGGVRHRLLRRLLAVVGVVALVAVAAATTTGYLVYREAESNLTRVAVGSLETTESPSDARHFLLVGSDDRSGLTRQEQRELTLGTEEEFGGQRSDTTMYVRVSADRSQVSLISIPRDLIVRTADGGQGKLTDQFVGGPEAVVDALGRTYGLTVNHYAQVSLGGFIDVVDTLGGVTIELDEPLVDRKSGAEFREAGEYEMDPVEALSYVRSRIGSDYARMDRQQTFIRAVLEELTATGNLANPARLIRLVEDVSTHLTTDEGLGASEMRYLATELRDAVSDGIPMATFPSYSVELPPSPGLPGGWYVLPYEPGARALQEAIASGEPLPEMATQEQAAEVRVAMVPGDQVRATGNVLAPTLVYANYDLRTWSAAPSELHAGARTVVYPALPGKTTQAGWVAALLGAEVRDLPAGVERPANTDVIVAVGADAAGDDDTAVAGTGSTGSTGSTGTTGSTEGP
jgi:LCP family protein required for cell wall assembly